MQKELVIATTPQETKIAILEDDELVEYYIERHRSQGIVGNIYKGKVTKVLPGMQSAFVDIGLERDAFLYVSDFFEDTEEYDKIVSTVEEEVAQLHDPGQALRGSRPVPLPVQLPQPLVRQAIQPVSPPVVLPAEPIRLEPTVAEETESIQLPGSEAPTAAAMDEGSDRRGPRRRDRGDRDRDRRG